MDQQKIMQIQMMEQEGQQLNEQLQLIDRNISEMGELKESLVEIENGGDEILTNLGKGIYLPVKITNKNLIVEVGRGNYVKKNIKETEKVIDEQILKLTEGKGQIINRLNGLQMEMQGLILDFQEAQGRCGDECSCSGEEKCEDDECDCGEDEGCEDGKCDCDNDEKCGCR